MGNARSVDAPEEDVWWSNGDENQSQGVDNKELEEINVDNDQKSVFYDSTRSCEREQRKKELEEDFIKFKQDLARKHDRRRQLIVEKKKEMANLREELIKEKEENDKLRRLLEENRLTGADGNDKCRRGESPANLIISSLKEENEDLRNEVEKLKLILKERDIISDKNKELRISLAEMQRELQDVNSQIINFEKERIDYQEHVTALKDIIRVTKEMLHVRENQIEELKKKIATIEEILASKEMNILSNDLRQEYERQLKNMRDLRNLYEERQRVDRREKENLQTQIEELKKTVETEQNQNGEHKERIDELEEDNSKKYDKIVNLESNLGLAKAECKELHGEMNIINQLFSQILISFNNDQDVDLDNMTKILEENHDLLTKIVVNDESNETSALPKVLLDLVNQVNENRKDIKDIPPSNVEQEPISQEQTTDKLATIQEEAEAQLSGMHQLNSPEEIVENLPKVWRVLIELLSHQSPPNNEITEKKGENDSHCYKSVETPTGLTKVLSVSKTFIRLKSLILEKKSLEKEMTRLKQLNTHLEGRLSDQEKRLVLVSNELSKTWNFVGKMQKQHQQLHTQEKILRYELAQKRKLLTELKEELEYCRQKWLQARKQNSSTEEQWKQLRTEFASRKRTINDDINNSVESGYSDDKSSSDEDDADFHEKARRDEAPAEKLNLSVIEDQVVKPLEASASESRNAAEEINVLPSVNEEDNQENTKEDVKRDGKDATLDVVDSTSSGLHSLETKTDLEEICEVKNEESLLNTNDPNREERLPNTEEKIPVLQPNTAHDEISTTCTNDFVEKAEDASSSLQNIDLEQPSTAQKTSINANDEIATSCTNDFVEKAEDASSSLQNIDLEQPSTAQETSINANDEIATSCTNDLVEKAEDASSSLQNIDLEQPSTSHKSPTQAAEEFAARREERMKRLEEQCNELYFSVAKTSLRGLVMSTKLDNLHEMYGDNSQTTSDRDASESDENNQEEEQDVPKVITDSSQSESNQE